MITPKILIIEGPDNCGKKDCTDVCLESSKEKYIRNHEK